MKIHKITMYVCDPNHFELTLDEVKEVMERTDHIVHFAECETKDDGREEWLDSHFLNYKRGAKALANYFKRL